MASIHCNRTTGVYYLSFRFGGRQWFKSLRTRHEPEANSHKFRIERMLDNMRLGVLPVPPKRSFWTYLFTGGLLDRPASFGGSFTIRDLFDRYAAGLPTGTLEESTLYTHRIHRKHLFAILDERTAVDAIDASALQSYINKRSRQTYRKRLIGSYTIRKELATLRAVWNWARSQGILTNDPPTRGLRFPKLEAKPPFQTWDEIQRQIESGGLSQQQIDRLWETLFLSKEQVAECLEHIRANASYHFIYPMVVFVAHTGARRSEMLRASIRDIDMTGRIVTLWEKKRDQRVRLTRRRVPMSTLMYRVMGDWLANHPGGHTLFRLPKRVVRSKKRKGGSGSDFDLTGSEASKHLNQALSGSKWEVVRGFHTFRHSFASNLAASGERQEIIDEYMGHQTEDMRKRYRHLFPHEKENAIRKVFG